MKVSSELEAEEAILRNTFVNAQSGPMTNPNIKEEIVPRQAALKWTDAATSGPGDKSKLALVAPP